MENASKALIIAGAILLAILLISLGVMIFTTASNTVNNSGMSDAELTTFNSKFTKYEGNQKGSTIRSLVQEVLANNTNDQASDETTVAITGLVTLSSTTGTAQPTYASSFSNTKTYKVSFTYKNGRVSVINIAAVTV